MNNHDEQFFFERASTLIDLKRYKEALKEASLGLVECPESFSLHTLMSQAYINLDQLDPAEQSITTAIRLEPENPYGYYIRSHLMREKKAFNKELSMAQRAVQLDPEDPDYLYRLSEAYMQSGMIKQAKDACYEMINLSPDSGEAHSLMGDISLELEEWTLAETHYLAALKIDPNRIALLNNLAISLSRQKKYKEGLELLLQAMQQNPTIDYIQDNLFDFIKDYLDKNTLKGRSAALDDLSPVLRIFYEDRQPRVSIFERYSNYGMYVFWALLLVIVTILGEAFSS